MGQTPPLFSAIGIYDAAARTAFLCVVKGPLARELVVRLGAVTECAFPEVAPPEQALHVGL